MKEESSGVQSNHQQQRSQDASLVLQSPFVLLYKCVDDFFHRKVWDQLIYRERCPCHWIKVSDSLQMFFDVLSFICYSRWGDHRFLENLKADLSANEVWDFPLATTVVDLGKHVVQLGCVILLKRILSS